MCFADMDGFFFSPHFLIDYFTTNAYVRQKVPYWQWKKLVHQEENLVKRRKTELRWHDVEKL